MLTQSVRKGVNRVIDDVDNCIKPTQRTIYHELIEGLRDHTQKSRDANMRYLVDESFAIVGAAGDTTGNAMVSKTKPWASQRLLILILRLSDAGGIQGPYQSRHLPPASRGATRRLRVSSRHHGRRARETSICHGGGQRGSASIVWGHHTPRPDCTAWGTYF